MRTILSRQTLILSVTLAGLGLGFSGCSMWGSDEGLFEDQTLQYKEAKSLENPLSGASTGGSYDPDPLYPVPKEVGGRLLESAPRVVKAFIPLEQGAIALVKSANHDKIVVSNLYSSYLTESIEQFLAERNLFALPKENIGEAANTLKESVVAQSEWSHLQVSQWASAAQLEYPIPGFFRRLFGADSYEHQFAFVIQNLENTEGVQQYSAQFKMAHRTRQDDADDPSSWHWSMDEDTKLGDELTLFVDLLRREVALASAGNRSEITASLEVDGNGLSYLAISDRFAFVWETLLDVIPKKQWKIDDVDRSQGIVFLNIRDDEVLTKAGIEQLHLHLTEGPQMMTLSVEVNENDPASAEVSKYVLGLLQREFSNAFEESKNGRSKSE